VRSAETRMLPADQAERERALDTGRCVLVRAPAGSGKTDLLTRRFLRLLGEVDEPGEIVAITFTKAAAAEMRHRILKELENAAAEKDREESDADEISIEALARRALKRSRERGWNLIDLPSQLRISTIDAFGRELALQQPLLSGLGGGLDICEQPRELYRRAARRILGALDGNDAKVREAIEALLVWRDNSWQEMEDQLVEMLEQRDRWMRDFVLGQDVDWEAVRDRLERPFRTCVQEALEELSRLLDGIPGAREEGLALARFACEQSGGELHRDLAECAEFPDAPHDTPEDLETARQVCACLASFVLTGNDFRKQVNKLHGFPLDRKQEKARMLALIANLRKVEGLQAALVKVQSLPAARYTEEEWRIVQACFILLKHAAGELHVVFAEASEVDYIEVAQVAESVLKGESEIPSEAALAVANGIRHLLVDEFQDTSRKQHQLLARLIAAWETREARTCFVVGDPMQSIYFFRDADAELFPRVERAGLEIPGELPFEFDLVSLRTNFRTERSLIESLNKVFERVFEADDGSDVTFSRAEPRAAKPGQFILEIAGADAQRMQIHLEFMPETVRAVSIGPDAKRERERIAEEREAARERQTRKIVDVIRGHLAQIEPARLKRQKYRIAVLGRTKTVLAGVAKALREAGIPFRAVELEELKGQPEVVDALALGRALMNAEDRLSWLGVLRAPWCGLSLEDLHVLVSGDDDQLKRRPVPELMRERAELLSEHGKMAVGKILRALEYSSQLRFRQPEMSLGTWLEQVWLLLGGAQCVDATWEANVELLWRALDHLPEGEQDLLGPALDVTLEKLTAQPDANADNDFGVQLMTIHKSKGLEFEVVIVPDLQSGAAHSRGRLLSWLERGLAEPDESGDITEFLVAPLQTKGADRGMAKEWVDRVYRDRELQEMRRILYVAATRARDELHLFARPAYKTAADGTLHLATPRESLLLTAWPAFEAEIEERFTAWCAPEEAEVASIAASGEHLLHVVSATSESSRGVARLRRLPIDYGGARKDDDGFSAEVGIRGTGSLYQRHEGGLISRVLGIAVHTLLQEAARLRQSEEWGPVRAMLLHSLPRVAARIRSVGVERTQAARIAEQALRIALTVTSDTAGEWILSPHAEAENEVRWAGVDSGSVRSVQVDRVFRGGLEPLSEGDDAWWIVDYKTAHEEGVDPDEALPRMREIFAPQIEAYAKVLRNLRGADATVRAGLYYPQMLRLDWWEI